MKNLFTLSAVAAALLATAAVAAPVPPGLDAGGITVAREAERGDDRGQHGKGHRLSDESATSVAREAERGDDRGHHGKGHRLSDESGTNVAREKSEGARGHDPHAAPSTDAATA